MGERVNYSVEEAVATIAMDDGKVNALSPDMQLEINEGLDHAELEGVGAVVIAGSNKVFSGGFDLKVLTAGGQPAIDMLAGGFELAARVLAFPKPVVMACTGHSIAMGSFLMLSGDHLIGAPSFRVQANEVSIGLTMPGPALAILRHRLTPAAFQRYFKAKVPLLQDISTNSPRPSWCARRPRKLRQPSPAWTATRTRRASSRPAEMSSTRSAGRSRPSSASSSPQGSPSAALMIPSIRPAISTWPALLG
jgi:hypothetical protein